MDNPLPDVFIVCRMFGRAIVPESVQDSRPEAKIGFFHGLRSARL
jgi:hypothetical protein